MENERNYGSKKQIAMKRLVALANGTSDEENDIYISGRIGDEALNRIKALDFNGVDFGGLDLGERITAGEFLSLIDGKIENVSEGKLEKLLSKGFGPFVRYNISERPVQAENVSEVEPILGVAEASESYRQIELVPGVAEASESYARSNEMEEVIEIIPSDAVDNPVPKPSNGVKLIPEVEPISGVAEASISYENGTGKVFKRKVEERVDKRREFKKYDWSNRGREDDEVVVRQNPNYSFPPVVINVTKTITPGPKPVAKGSGKSLIQRMTERSKTIGNEEIAGEVPVRESREKYVLYQDADYPFGRDEFDEKENWYDFPVLVGKGLYVVGKGIYGLFRREKKSESA